MKENTISYTCMNSYGFLRVKRFDKQQRTSTHIGSFAGDDAYDEAMQCIERDKKRNENDR